MKNGKKKEELKKKDTGQALANTASAVLPRFSQKYEGQIHLGLLLIIFLIIYVACFTNKISLGGDNIYYYTLGKALASGHGYVDIISPTLTPNNHFPPGYPFIISLFMRLGFEDIAFFYGLNGVFTFLSIIVLYKLLLRLSFGSRLAFVTCFFVTINTGILSFAITNMSEIPYMLFSLLTLYLLAGLDFKKKVYQDVPFLLMIGLIIATYYIRTSGVALVLAVAIYLSIRKKWLHVVSFIAVFFLAILPWQLRSNALGGNSYVKQLLSKNPYAPELGKAGISDFASRALANVVRYITIEIPSSVTGTLFDNGGTSPVRNWISGICLLLLVAYAFVRFFKKSLALLPMLLYLLFTAGMLLLWPEKWIGIRFMLPIVPFLLFMLIYSVNSMLVWLSAKVKVTWNPYLLCVLGVFILAPIRLLSHLADEPYPQGYQNYFTLGEWAKTNTPENSVICCRKPELFYLFSDRKCVNYPFTLEADSIIHTMERDRVDYVVVEQLGYGSTAKYLAPAINQNTSRFKILVLLKEPETYFIKFKKPGESVAMPAGKNH